MLPMWALMVSQLPGWALAPTALDAQWEPGSGEGPGQTLLPVCAAQWVRDGSNTGMGHVHAKPPRSRGATGARLWARGDRAASCHRGPWPHCSAHGILCRDPLFSRAGLRGRIPLSELGNILF